MVLSVLTLSYSIIEVSSCGRPCSVEYCNDSCANDGDRNNDDCSKVVCMGGSLGNCDGCGSSTCSIFFASILEDEYNSFECGSPIEDEIEDETEDEIDDETGRRGFLRSFFSRLGN